MLSLSAVQILRDSRASQDSRTLLPQAASSAIFGIAVTKFTFSKKTFYGVLEGPLRRMCSAESWGILEDAAEIINRPFLVELGVWQ